MQENISCYTSLDVVYWKNRNEFVTINLKIETWFLTIIKEYRLLNAFAIKVLKRTFENKKEDVTGGWRK
jgi:hypothetical protein